MCVCVAFTGVNPSEILLIITPVTGAARVIASMTKRLKKKKIYIYVYQFNNNNNNNGDTELSSDRVTGNRVEGLRACVRHEDKSRKINIDNLLRFGLARASDVLGYSGNEMPVSGIQLSRKTASPSP